MFTHGHQVLGPDWGSEEMEKRPTKIRWVCTLHCRNLSTPEAQRVFFIKLSKEERLLPINKKAGLMVYQQIKETGLDLADLSKSTLCGGAVFRP